MREIHVSLIPTVEQQITRLKERTGLSDTDAVNRALTLYEYIDALLADGHEVLIRNGRTQEIQALRLL